jgi:hypothetical protein
MSSLPVPRSPITSTGRSSDAARLARSTASWKAADWPMNCVSRSIPNHWQIFPLIGKGNRSRGAWFLHEVAQVFRPFTPIGTPPAEISSNRRIIAPVQRKPQEG